MPTKRTDARKKNEYNQDMRALPVGKERGGHRGDIMGFT
jgi:hypothetical protein